MRTNLCFVVIWIWILACRMQVCVHVFIHVVLFISIMLRVDLIAHCIKLGPKLYQVVCLISVQLLATRQWICKCNQNLHQIDQIKVLVGIPNELYPSLQCDAKLFLTRIMWLKVTFVLDLFFDYLYVFNPKKVHMMLALMFYPIFKNLFIVNNYREENSRNYNNKVWF